MTAAKYVFALLLMTGVLYACAVDGDEVPSPAGISQVDQELAVLAEDDLIVDVCGGTIWCDRGTPGSPDCQLCDDGTGGGGGGDPSGGGGGGGGDGGWRGNPIPPNACSQQACDPWANTMITNAVCSAQCGQPAACYSIWMCGPNCEPEKRVGYCAPGTRPPNM